MTRDEIQRLLDRLQENDLDRQIELNALELRFGPQARALAEQAKAPSAFQAAINAALSDINSEWREQNPTGAYLTALASVPGRAIMGTAPGKAIERASQRTTEAMMRDPGYGDRVGRVTTGIPWLDTASDVGGSILGQAALIAAASQMVGAGGAALAPHVPSVPPSPILDRAARGIMTATTKHALQSLSAPEEAKPTEKELARDIAFHATAGPAAMAIGKALPATMSPWTAEAIKGAGSGLASGVATMPFAEEDENHLKNIGMQMATMALFNVASLAANPTQRKAAEIARDRAIRQVIEEREAAEAAYRRFGIEMPKRVMGRKARQDIEREIRDVYRYMARKAHPDVGGTAQDFQELIGARDSALSYLEKANMPKMIREQAIEWVNSTFRNLFAGQEPPAAPTSTALVPYDESTSRPFMGAPRMGKPSVAPTQATELIAAASVAPADVPPATTEPGLPTTQIQDIAQTMPSAVANAQPEQTQNATLQSTELETVPEPVATEEPVTASRKPSRSIEQVPHVAGRQSKVFTGSNQEVETAFAVVDLGELEASHDVQLRVNPNYPQELQPRDRQRAASELQINEIVNKLQPERLGDSPEASGGAPIVGQDMVVESGNGRVIALGRLALSNHPNWQSYQDWLMQNAERFGINPSEISDIKNPVLVRVRLTDVDREAFTTASNVPGVAAMSATEQALSDAQRMTPGMLGELAPGEDGNMLAASNRGFISNFFQNVIAPEERGRYLMADGSVSQEGIRRMESAVFAYAYGESVASIEKLAEDPDSNIRNITGAMLNVAGKMADVKSRATGDYQGLDIAGDIATAATKLSQLRFEGTTVEEFLIQAPMFGEELTPEQKNILATFDQHKRSRKKLTEIFSAYADAVLSLEHPDQAQLFATQTPTKNELLQAAINLVESGDYGLQTALWTDQPVASEGVGEPLAETLPEPAAVGGAPAEIAGEAGLTADATGTAGEDLVPLEPGPFEDEILDAEPDIPPPARASSGGPLGIAAGQLPGTLRPISEITGKNGSLLSYEYKLLPTELRSQLKAIDDQASMLNYLLSTRKRGTAEYNEINAKLVELEKQRIELEPEIENALGQKGPRLAGVKRELEEAASKVKGGLSFSDIDPETGETPDGVAGYIDGQPIYGQIVYGPDGTVERYIPPSVEPDDEFYENLADQPNLYEVIAGLPRDVFGEPIVRDFRSAKREHDPFLKQYMDILAEIFRGDARNVDLLEEVTDALEGKADVSAAAKEIAGNLRNLFYGNSPSTALFRDFEIDPGRFIEDYAPRIREQGDYKVTGIPKELSFFAEMYRTGELQPRERNALKIAKAYLRAGARKKFFGPVVEKWEPAIGKMHPDKRRMYEDFVNMVLGRPSREERITNELIKNIVNPIIRPLRKEIGGRPAQVITSMIADMTYTATIGGNIFSGIKNLTQQFLAIYAIDTNPIKGWNYWLKARALRATPQGKELLRYCWVSQDRDYLAAIDIADNTFGMIVGDKVDKVKDALFFPYKGADTDNVHQSYTMGVLKALDEGKSWNDVIEFGNEFAGDTQYLYGMDNPTKLRGPFGRLAFMFMSWPINFMRLLYKAYKANPARIATLVAGYAASLWALSKATGIDFSSSAGPSSTVQSWLPVKALRGEMSPPIKAAKLGYDVIQMRLDGLLNGTDEELFEEVKHDFFEALKRSTVPAYSQYSRIEKFVDAALNDWWVYDVKGRKRYQMTSGEAVRGLFGPTMAARERRLEHDDVAREHREYQATRRKAIEAYLDGNMAEYRRANEALAQKWGRRITRQDIERELRLRETTAIERHRMGLPSEGSSTTTAPRLRTTVPKVSTPKTPKIKVYK